ncbi:MAG: radical SAM family heme chaperone HemW [Sedimentisphaerales bacterium]|nr:radical SAM family heme chaperone HemW [Sedimentisphaerales bacterium]
MHIPFCEAKCRYCGFYSEPVRNHNSARLVSAIITEFQMRIQTSFSPQTIYIGGGSPSCLPQEQLSRLVGEITSRWPKTDEFTIEVNPGQLNKTSLSQLRKMGVNRLSIGAQSFDNTELSFLGRRHSVENIQKAVDAAKKAGFQNIGLDLIFAIPGSTLASWEHNLMSAIDLGVQHVSTYALTYEEKTPLQKAVEAGEVKPVDEETDRLMYETAIEKLEKAGFRQYEISNFAKPGFECRHNLNYWANYPYIGVGPAAASFWNDNRTTNIAEINTYIEAIGKGESVIEESETPKPLQIACETAVLNLRRRCGIYIDEFQKQTGYEVLKLFAEPIDKYGELGLIEMTDGRLFLTREALPIADSILCDFSDV